MYTVLIIFSPFICKHACHILSFNNRPFGHSSPDLNFLRNSSLLQSPPHLMMMMMMIHQNLFDVFLVPKVIFSDLYIWGEKTGISLKIGFVNKTKINCWKNSLWTNLMQTKTKYKYSQSHFLSKSRKVYLQLNPKYAIHRQNSSNVVFFTFW